MLLYPKWLWEMILMDMQIKNFRDYIKSNELRNQANFIWKHMVSSLSYQRGQTGQGIVHCEAVESNLRKLLTVTKKMKELNDIEIFLLSMSACFHDIGKIDDKNLIDHGKIASKTLMKNYINYSLDQDQAYVIALIIGVHSSGSLEELQNKTELVNNEDIDVIRLSALFRLADMIETSYKRTPKVVEDVLYNSESTPEVWTARKRIHGWHLDKNNIIKLEAFPESKDEIKYLYKLESLMCEDLTKIQKYLEHYGYPSDIKLYINYKFIELLEEEKKNDSLNTSSKTNISSNLPSRGIFIGREAEIEVLYQAIKSNLRLIVVEGMAGIGKTSLALEVAHKFHEESLAASEKRDCQHNEFNVFIWITATSPITLENVLDIIARTLDYPYISQLDLEKKLDSVLKLLRKERILLIIDNFETISDEKVLQFVRDVPEPSKVLVTTRHQQFGNTQYYPLHLEKMQRKEGLDLIADDAKRLGLNLTQTDKNAVVLYNVTGGSPLAIKWAIGQIKQRGQSLTSIVEALRAARGDIFKYMFAHSWNLLTDVSKRILMSMPIFAATVSRGALKATVNINSVEFDEALGQLVELGLVESNLEVSEEKQRFSIHSLTRAFVEQETSNFPDLEEMRLRASRYYLEFCNKRRYLQLGMEGYDEIEAEVSNIHIFLEWLYDGCYAKQKRESCQILVNFSEAINVFFWSRGYWSDRVSLCERALQASKVLGDWSSAARQAYYIGIVRVWQGATEEAEKRAAESTYLLENNPHKKHTENYIDMALTQRLLALVMMRKGKYGEATDILQSILEKISQPGVTKSEEIRIIADWICPGPEGYKAGLVSLMQELGIIANAKEDYSSAKKWLEESRILAQQIGDSEGLSISLSHLGHALLGLQKIEEAKNMYLEGLKLATQVQRNSTKGRCNQGLANVAFIEGRPEDASRYAQEAINLFERPGMGSEMADVKKLIENNQSNLEP